MPAKKSSAVRSRIERQYSGWQTRRRIKRLANQVAQQAPPPVDQPPVVIFNASARLTGLSLNAAFSLLTNWSLRLAGVPVIEFVCRSGLQPCVLGTNRGDYTQPPPCPGCIAQSERLFAGGAVHDFTYQAHLPLATALENLTVPELSNFQFSPGPGGITTPIPLSRLVLPSIRWALRRHHLPDDEPTRYLLRAYMLSAYSTAVEFAALLLAAKPRLAVIFNGTMYPEAAARWTARQLAVPTVAHEVGFQRYSTFFTTGEPTAYPIDIPADFELSAAQNARLDGYLQQRFQGHFTMAGIQFWPEMRGLDEAFLRRLDSFRQLVPVFSNVVYDTSQVHANLVFPHMFAWLDLMLEIFRRHPETLFILRAHPDEMRPGTAKQSNESVHDWVKRNRVDQLPNVVFIDSQEYISSYELIQRAKFVVVYNSSIGMEAVLLGKPVLCGGQARYTQYPIVYFPDSIPGYSNLAEEMLAAENVALPPEYQRNARKFLYYQLYRTSLPLDNFIEAAPRMGFVRLRSFDWQDLLPENNPTMSAIHAGILHGDPFLMPDDLA